MEDSTDSECDIDAKIGGDTISKRHQGCLHVSNVYRRKVILTGAVCGSYVVLGWVVCQIGTALPDLQYLGRVDLNAASWLFTSYSIGYVIGSLVSGFLFDKFNRLILMLRSSLGTAACSISLPYSGSFTGMLAVRFITGIFCGSLDTGANTIVPSTWNEKCRPFMQALYLSYTFGGILSPFATRPFMLHKHTSGGTSSDIQVHAQTGNTSENVTYTSFSHDGLGQINVSQNHRQSIVSTVGLIHEYQSHTNVSLHYTHSNISNEDIQQVDSTIHYAFLITGAIVLTSCVPYILMLFNGKFDQREDSNETVKKKRDLLEKNKKAEEDQGMSCWKYFALLCIAGINMMYGATEDSLGDFLVTFCLDYLGWSNSAAVTLTSLYWMASCLGGLAGILLMRRLKPAQVLSTALGVWNVAFLVVMLAAIWKIDILVWVSITVSGLCMVLLIPTVISWTVENVCEISGKVSSVIMIATGVGLAANPTFIGHMMGEYSYLYFFYILLSEAVICTLLFVLANAVKGCGSRSEMPEKGCEQTSDCRTSVSFI